MSILNSKRLLVALILGLIASVAIYAALGASEAETQSNREEFQPKGDKPNRLEDVPGTVVADISYAFDPKDKRKLVGNSSAVFFGRVVAEVGNEDLPTSVPGLTTPQTQFTVKVTDRIKGKVPGTVTMNQLGGERIGTDGLPVNGDNLPAIPAASLDGLPVNEDGLPVQLSLFGGDPLLVPGEERLFFTNYDEEEGRYTIVAPPYGDKKVKGKAERTKLKKEVQKAKANQIKTNPAEERGGETPPDPYRPCLPDGTTPLGASSPCDPSDPLPGEGEKATSPTESAR